MLNNKVTDYGIRVDHLGLHVYDLEASINWYMRVFDFEYGKASAFRGGLFPKAHMSPLGDFLLEFYEVKNARPFTMKEYEGTIGVKHIGIAAENYTQWYEYAKDQGNIEFVYEDNTPGCESAFVRDENGILTRVLRDPEADSDIGRWGRFRMRVRQAALHVYDIQETAKWYEDVFGFEKRKMSANENWKLGTQPRMQEIELNHFILELYEVPCADPFSLEDYEYNIGPKHLDITTMDRAGWTDYIRRNDLPVPVIVSHGHRVHTELPLLPHYVLDNNNILIEVSNDYLYGA